MEGCGIAVHLMARIFGFALEKGRSAFGTDLASLLLTAPSQVPGRALAGR
jgi:hypothetical protein